MSDANPPSQTTPPPGLYERIGGEGGIARLVEIFYSRVLDDEKLAPFFKEVPMDKLRRMQLEFFSAATGGPAVYSGRPLSHVHRGRGIESFHFQRFTDHLFEVLEAEFELGRSDIDAIIDGVNVYADDITGDSANSG